MMNRPDRGPLLTVFAVLFGLLGVSDLTKALQVSHGAGLRPGFVLFGDRLSGMANAVVAPLFGLYLLVYAVGIWRMRRWALPMGVLYALYVTTNLTLFMFRDAAPMREGVLFGAIYAVVAIGVSWGAARMLSQRRSALT
jgi:hypothetical protein